MAGSRFTSDFSGFTVRLLQRHGRAVAAINDHLEIGAKRIASTARDMAPVDHGNLEKAIKVENQGLRRKWAVYVDESTPAEGGKTVGDYITFIHEDLTYRLGEKSRAKQEANPGVIVGPRFMDRAAEQELPAILARLERLARRYYGGQ